MDFLFPPEARSRFRALLAVAERYAGANRRWLAIRDKEYSAEVAERSRLTETMAECRAEYDSMFKELPAQVSDVMNFAHITR